MSFANQRGKDSAISTLAFDITVVGIVVDTFSHIPVAYIGADFGNIHVGDKMTQLITYLCLLDEEHIRNTFECVLGKIDACASRDLAATREILSSAFALVDGVNEFDSSKLEYMMDLSDRALLLIEEEEGVDLWYSFSKQISEAVLLLLLCAVTTKVMPDIQKRALQMIERILFSKNSDLVKALCLLISSVIERRDTECLPIRKYLSSVSDIYLIPQAFSDPNFVVSLTLAGMRSHCFKCEEKDFSFSISNILDSIFSSILSDRPNTLEDPSWVCAIHPLTVFSCLAIESSATPRILNAFLNRLEVLHNAFDH